MSDHDAAPGPIDEAYVRAEAMLSDDAARAARRARVLAAVGRVPAASMAAAAAPAATAAPAPSVLAPTAATSDLKVLAPKARGTGALAEPPAPAPPPEG